MKHIEPMLCKLGTIKDLERKDYLFEPKLDGTRAICHVGQDYQIINRRNNNITYRYPEFANLKKYIKASNCILDGEIIVYDKHKNPSFRLLQQREHLVQKNLIQIRSKELPAHYIVFDILAKNGKDLTQLPLEERQKILHETVKDCSFMEKIVCVKNGRKLWEHMIKKNQEGVIGKESSSPYFIGRRTQKWIKIKHTKTIDCIIIGYTQEKRSLSALAVAVYENKKLFYIGRLGTGFSETVQKDLLKKLEPLKTDKNPANYTGPKSIQWVKPKLVCEAEYLFLTPKKQLRAPVFLRLRHDKKPTSCTLADQVA